MRILRNSVNVGELQKLYYHSFILPHLLYCSSLFNYSLTSAQHEILNSLQRKAARLLNSNDQTNLTPLKALMSTNAERTWTRMGSSGLLDEYQRPSRLRQKTRMVFARTEVRRRQFIPAHSKLQNPDNRNMIVNF